MTAQTGCADHREWVLDLLDEFEGRLVQYALRLTRGDHETSVDAVQHTFLKLCGQSRDLVEPRMPGWLYRVCRNKIIDDARRRRREESAPDPTIEPMTSREINPELSVEQADLNGCLQRLVDCLPNAQREAIQLWCHGFGYEEIANTMDKSNGAVRVLVHRALTHLRTHPQVKEWLTEQVSTPLADCLPQRTLVRSVEKK